MIILHQMKTLLFLPIILLLSLSPVSGEEGTQFDGEEAREVIKQYFADPKEDILVTIETVENEKVLDSVRSAIVVKVTTEDKENTFKAVTPYCFRLPFGRIIAVTREQVEPLKLAEIHQVLLQLPVKFPPPVLIAQSQSPSGIKGTVYWDGKERSSALSNTPYGVITLTIKYPFEEGLAKPRKRK